MIELNSNDLIQLLSSYGYLAVFLFVAVESAGVPVPGEAMLIVASAYAGTTHNLQGMLVIAAAALGAIAGDNLGYLAGRFGGYRLLRKYGRFIKLDERRLGLGQHLFDHHGGKVVFFGRFVAVLRIWAAFLAGAHRMRWSRFLLFNAAGGIIWAAGMGSLAFVFGNRILRYGGPAGIAGAVIATGIMVAVGVTLHRQEQRMQRAVDRSACCPLALAS
jgi:membrane protein DedA with SNARE-associated domain